MAAHNYDGDMLTDEIAQVHRSPGFITSNLIGKREDGTMIKEFEASHGTVADLWNSHLRGEETSMNPLGLIEALLGAMDHSAHLAAQNNNPENAREAEAINQFTKTLRSALQNTFRYGQGTRDMAGPEGLTTEKFVDKVAWRLGRYLAAQDEELSDNEIVSPARNYRRNYNVDETAMEKLFKEYDTDKDGKIGLKEFETLLVNLGVAPMIDPLKRGSASSDKSRE